MAKRKLSKVWNINRFTHCVKISSNSVYARQLTSFALCQCFDIILVSLKRANPCPAARQVNVFYRSREKAAFPDELYNSVKSIVNSNGLCNNNCFVSWVVVVYDGYMPKPEKYNFAQYFWRAFGYLVIIWLPVIFFIGANILISRYVVSGESLRSRLGFLLYALAIVILPVILVIIAYKVSKKARTRLHHRVIIFLVLLLLSSAFGFLFISAFGGVSQAVVEGGASPLRHLTYVTHSLLFGLFTSPVLIVLTILGSYRLYNPKNKVFNIAFVCLLILIPLVVNVVTQKRLKDEFIRGSHSNSFFMSQYYIKAGQNLSYKDISPVDEDRFIFPTPPPDDAIRGNEALNIVNGKYHVLEDIEANEFVTQSKVRRIQ